MPPYFLPLHRYYISAALMNYCLTTAELNRTEPEVLSCEKQLDESLNSRRPLCFFLCSLVFLLIFTQFGFISSKWDCFWGLIVPHVSRFGRSFLHLLGSFVSCTGC